MEIKDKSYLQSTNWDSVLMDYGNTADILIFSAKYPFGGLSSSFQLILWESTGQVWVHFFSISYSLDQLL